MGIYLESSELLEIALKEDLLGKFAWLRVPDSLFAQRPDLVQMWKNTNLFSNPQVVIEKGFDGWLHMHTC